MSCSDGSGHGRGTDVWNK